MTSLSASLAAALLVCCSSGAAAAVQAPELHGRVLDGVGRPLAASEVALHRVTPAGGAIVARDTTDADGRFTLAVPGATDDAVLFAATRVDGRLYVGGVFRGAAPRALYRIVAAGPGVQSPRPRPRPSTLAPAPTPPPARWTLVAGVGLLLAGGLGLAIRSVRRDATDTRRRRSLLLELASLDEACARPDDALQPGKRERYLRRRARLHDRLRHPAHRSP